MTPSLEVVSTRGQIAAVIDRWRAAGRRIGLVPTMGALHDGHASLAKRARAECDAAIVTIFVNPTQFGPGEDFERYPRPLSHDLEQLSQWGVQAAFVPSPEEIFRPGHTTYVEPPEVARRLEGAVRPGHFRGVSTICLKLFHMIPADVAYFGQKDYQQFLVVKTMVAELDLPLQIRMVATVREADGLALSSRNAYLSHEDRHRAVAIPQALAEARGRFRNGQRDARQLEEAMRCILEGHGVTAIDYATVADSESLRPVAEADAGDVALVAVHVGTTRLIDNMRLGEGP